MNIYGGEIKGEYYYNNGHMIRYRKLNDEDVKQLFQNIKMNTGFFVDDLQEGESVFFDMYGDICQKSFYTNNKKHGMCITYFPKSSGGGVSQRAEYNNGVLVGKQEMFYTTGELLQVTPYNQGKAQEYTRSFNQKGGLLVDPAIK